MWDGMITGFFIFLAAVLGYDTFKRWRTSQKVLYLVAIGSFILAAMSAIVDWGSALFFILGGMVVRVLAQNSGSKKPTEAETNESDEGNLK